MMNIKILPVLLIVGALVAGYASKIFTKQNDHPIEQAAESVLRSHGIDLDFSPDDKDE
jgi:hypothetical protein